MIQLDPTKRGSANSYLDQFESRIFPDYFSSFLHPTIAEASRLHISIGHESFQADAKIEFLYERYHQIADVLGMSTKLGEIPEEKKVHIRQYLTRLIIILDYWFVTLITDEKFIL